LLDYLAFGQFRGFLLGDRLVKIWVKSFASGVDFFQTRFGHSALELLLDHSNAGD
jgi:hypothetical protein